MKLSECKIGFAITGSFCTFDKVIPQIDFLMKEGAEITPIFSTNAYSFDTRFANAKDYVLKIMQLTNKQPIHTIVQAEPIGPQKLFDCMVISPCTGNTIAKLANGISDTPVLMAAKAHLRNNLPLVIAISSNDALGINFQNIGKLMVMKHIYFVPFGQDHYETKPNSLVADLSKLQLTIEAALEGKQYEPLLYESIK